MRKPIRGNVPIVLTDEQLAYDPDVKRYSDVEEALRELKSTDTVKKADAFFSESNVAFLRRGIAALKAGEGAEHELIEEISET